MIIENYSMHRLSDLKPLVLFASRHVPMAHMARLKFVDSQDREMCTKGMAYSADPFNQEHRPDPSLVVIDLSSVRQYPCQDQYLPEVPAVTLRSWEEEVLLVLAHEFRHIEQYWTWRFEDLIGWEMEIDAELFAIKVLDAWRAARDETTLAAA